MCSINGARSDNRFQLNRRFQKPEFTLGLFLFPNPTGARHCALPTIDSLLVINSLNRQGTRALGGSGGEGEDGRYFYDVNADGFISPIDALMVLNRLNQQGAGAGEGEANDVVFDTTADDGVDSILDDLASDVLDQWRKKR